MPQSAAFMVAAAVRFQRRTDGRDPQAKGVPDQLFADFRHVAIKSAWSSSRSLAGSSE
jgi:hypothetical protein